MARPSVVLREKLKPATVHQELRILRQILNVAARKKIILFRFVDARRDVAQRVRIGIDEAMARRDIARWSDADQTEPRAARVRFIHSLMQLGQGVADVREAVMFAAKRVRQIFRGEHAKLVEHRIETFIVDRI